MHIPTSRFHNFFPQTRSRWKWYSCTSPSPSTSPSCTLKSRRFLFRPVFSTVPHYALHNAAFPNVTSCANSLLRSLFFGRARVVSTPAMSILAILKFVVAYFVCFIQIRGVVSWRCTISPWGWKWSNLFNITFKYDIFRNDCVVVCIFVYSNFFCVCLIIWNRWECTCRLSCFHGDNLFFSYLSHLDLKII